MSTTPSVQQSALQYIQAGISIIPIKRGGTKRTPLRKWNPYRERPATDAELRSWFDRKAPYGIATVCGGVSGNLEVMDFDEESDVNFPEWRMLVETEAPGLVARLSIVKTPRKSSGFHVRYRIGGITPLTTKLAMNEDGKVTLIETRGDGGYALAPGSPAECHENNAEYQHIEGPAAWNPSTITPAERDILWRCAASFDRHAKEPGNAFKELASDRILPGDDYCGRGPDWAEILIGWEMVRQTDECDYWRRPGKSGSNWSATTGRCKNQKGHDLLSVFSSNASPFPGPHAGKQCSVHSKFQAFTLLNHGGDFGRAAAALRDAGFGSRDQSGANSAKDAQPKAERLWITPVLVSLADVEPRSVEWLWPGRIAIGKVTLLSGDPGLGKSFVTLDIAARVSCGAPWPDSPGINTIAGGVVLLSAEDDAEDTIRPRLDAARADVRRIYAFLAVSRDYKEHPTKESTFSLETDLAALETAIVATHGCRLVVIDPITAYLGGTDSHKNGEIRALIAPLAALATKYRIAVLCVTHLNKSGNGPAIYRSIGSIAFAAAARAVWAVAKDKYDSQRRLILPAKNNLAPDTLGLAYRLQPSSMNGTAVVCWEPDPVDMSADDAMQTVVGQADGGDSNQAQAWLTEALKDGPMPAAEVLAQGKANGFTEKMTRRAFHGLGGKSEKTGFKEGWLLRLSSAEPNRHSDGESSASSQKHGKSSKILGRQDSHDSQSFHEDSQDAQRLVE